MSNHGEFGEFSFIFKSKPGDTLVKWRKGSFWRLTRHDAAPKVRRERI